MPKLDKILFTIIALIILFIPFLKSENNDSLSEVSEIHKYSIVTSLAKDFTTKEFLTGELLLEHMFD